MIRYIRNGVYLSLIDRPAPDLAKIRTTKGRNSHGLDPNRLRTPRSVALALATFPVEAC